jgi:hypothetical protein
MRENRHDLCDLFQSDDRHVHANGHLDMPMSTNVDMRIFIVAGANSERKTEGML